MANQQPLQCRAVELRLDEHPDHPEVVVGGQQQRWLAPLALVATGAFPRLLLSSRGYRWCRRHGSPSTVERAQAGSRPDDGMYGGAGLLDLGLLRREPDNVYSAYIEAPFLRTVNGVKDLWN